MAGMKISLSTAMRARDVSQPRAADEAAAERIDAAMALSRPEAGTRSAATDQAPSGTADVVSEGASPDGQLPAQQLAAEHLPAQAPAEEARSPASTDRGRGRRRHSSQRRR